MNNLTKNLMCVYLRNGIEIWLEQDKITNLKDILRTEIKFVEIDDEFINTADITGIFTPQRMQELTRRKNGEWLCKLNKWHMRGEKCECTDKNEQAKWSQFKTEVNNFFEKNNYYPTEAERKLIMAKIGITKNE